MLPDKELLLSKKSSSVDNIENSELAYNYPNVQEIKILLIKEKVAVTVYTLEVPLFHSQLDIISTIFNKDQIQKDNYGYKLVDNRTERRLVFTNLPNPGSFIYKYVIEIGFPIIIQKDPIAHDKSHIVKPKSTDALENTFKAATQHNTAQNLIKRRSTLTAVNNNSQQINKYVENSQLPKMKLPALNKIDTMLNSKTFSDVTLCVNDKDIYAHKIILADKSPVFEAMFMHEMLESQTNKVEIIDVDYDTMFELLHYIYTDKFSKDKKEDDVYVKYSNLLAAANKYSIDTLKSKCEQKLLSLLRIENVLEVYLFAETHNTVNLKQKVTNFIVANAAEIIELPLFKTFVVSHADLTIDIMRALVIEKENSRAVKNKRKRK